MATFNLTASTNDSLVGVADVADSFFVGAVGDLTGTDTVVGGTGSSIEDRLVLTASMTLGAAAFANVSGIERLVFNASGGSTVTLADPMVASTHLAAFYVTGGLGNDVLIGGAVGSTSLRMTGAGGNDRLEGGGGGDRISGGVGNDTLRGAAGSDTLSGGAGNDQLEAGDGNDRLDGGAGNDLILFVAAGLTLADLVADESGTADTLQFTDSTAVAFTAGVAARVSGIERLLFGGGADTFTPGATFSDGVDAASVFVDGGAGDDSLDASGLASLTPLAVSLAGGVGMDTLVGGRGNDTLDAGIGAGRMDGGAGDDLLIVRGVDLTGSLAISGGTNSSTSTGGDTLRLVAGGTVSAAQLAGITGFEFVEFDLNGPPGEIVVPDSLAAGVSSSAVDLTVRGTGADDSFVLTGLAAGRDIVVQAGDGDDTVLGGAGDDTVHAGPGADTIQLGTGTDTVVFGARELGALDTVGADAGVAGDRLEVTLAAGRTLPATAFAGVTGFDVFQFTNPSAGTQAAVRLPSTLVSQSGLSSVSVAGVGPGGLIVDGRSAAGTWSLGGGTGNDILFGGSGVNTLSGSTGEDTVVGGDGGDLITLSGTTDRDLALITAATDGTVDINGLLSASALAGADQVSGLTSEGNFIAVDWQALGLSTGSTLFNNAGSEISLEWGAIVLPTAEEIAGNAFGSLSAVRNVVGSRLGDNVVGVDERLILVIGGENEAQFGVYYFEDRDDNATIDLADVLVLLAVGNGDVPGFASGRGFTLATLDLG